MMRFFAFGEQFTQQMSIPWPTVLELEAMVSQVGLGEGLPSVPGSQKQ